MFDYFPMSTGYFTSRPALKRYVRAMSGMLQSCKQLESFAVLHGLKRSTSSSSDMLSKSGLMAAISLSFMSSQWNFFLSFWVSFILLFAFLQWKPWEWASIMTQCREFSIFRTNGWCIGTHDWRWWLKSQKFNLGNYFTPSIEWVIISGTTCCVILLL